jgi:hypothetical protein
MDGQYTGSASMITPPSGLSGTAAAPIIVRCATDGGCVIDGQSARNPFYISQNAWSEFTGFDVANSSGTGALIEKSSNIVVRRICVWSTNTISKSLWMMTESHYVLLEDVCAFGTGNKVFAAVGGQFLPLTIRRAWGVWERGTIDDPKSVFNMNYRSRGILVENSIGGWNYAGGNTNQVSGIFTTAGLSKPNQCGELRYLGNIAYVRSNDVANSALGMGFFGSRSVDCVLVKDHLINIESHSQLTPIQGQKFDGVFQTDPTIINAPVGDRVLQNITEIGGSDSNINTDPTNGWRIINRVTVDGVSAANSAGANPFQTTSGNGARVCKRYVDGVITTQPLWPWPMDDRINTALRRAGKTPSNYFRGTGNTLTSEIETQFGTIPSACKEASQQPVLPAAPTVLLVRP